MKVQLFLNLNQIRKFCYMPISFEKKSCSAAKYNFDARMLIWVWFGVENLAGLLKLASGLNFCRQNYSLNLFKPVIKRSLLAERSNGIRNAIVYSTSTSERIRTGSNASLSPDFTTLKMLSDRRHDEIVPFRRWHLNLFCTQTFGMMVFDGIFQNIYP